MRTLSTPRARSTNEGNVPPEGSAGPGRARGTWILLALVCLGAAGLYLHAYPRSDLQPVGWDVHAYTWQIKAASAGPLSGVGIRPGFPVLGAMLRAAVPVGPASMVVILPLVLSIALALASAVAARTAVRFPRWSIVVVTAVVATSAGTLRLAAGYEAALLALTLFTAGLAALSMAEAKPGRVTAAGAIFAAGCLAHPIFFAAFAGLVGLSIVVSIPDLRRQQRTGVPVLGTDAGAVGGAMLGAAAVGGVALFGLLGASFRGALDTSAVRGRFAHLTNEALIRARWPASVPLAAVGIAGGRAASPERPGRFLRRLGLLWLGAAAVGAVVGRAGAPVPGHRAILFSPFPAVVGLGVVVLGLIVGLAAARERLSRVSWIAWPLIAVSVIGLAIPGALFFHRTIGPRRSAVWDELRSAAALVEGLPSGRPVVFVVQDDGPASAGLPKLERNVIRATMPAAAVARTFVYVGDLARLRAGRPTLAPAGASWRASYDHASLSMWAESGPALRAGAAVLVVRSYDAAGFEAASAQAPDRVVAPGLFVERGPAAPLGPVPPDPPFTLVAAAASAGGVFLLLLIVGWGLARAVLPRAGLSALEVACLSPAVGAAAVVLAGFVVALLGFDPAGPAGVAVLAALVLAGLALDPHRVRAAR